ncbi:MAG: phenazine biosynthesis protein PhzF family [Pseudonocardiales bacterium]|nr:phenazine biosynthesis protein PhzF family [Pseudonocardiales bacterium]
MEIAGLEVLRYAAFTSDPGGGNPAGVVLDAATATVTDMQEIAAEIGYSETAFLVPRGDAADGRPDFDVRYFSPLAEVPFCGHATIASAVAFAERHGTGAMNFRTAIGLVTVITSDGPDGVSATLTSVPPRVEQPTEDDVRRLLAALRLSPDQLDQSMPIRIAFAGAHHPIVAVAERETLTALDYQFGALKVLMAERDWTTINLVWRESGTVFHARNPFPPGGIVEDPATGAAAAAFGGYLRALELVELPATLTIHQGDDLGRPSLLTVGIAVEADSGIEVTGTAVALD